MQAILEYLNLRTILRSLKQPTDQPDYLSWKWEPSGEYTSWSAYQNPIPTNANLIFLGSSTLSLLRLGDRSERRPTVYALEGCRTLIVVSSIISMRSRSHFGHVSGIPPTLVACAHNKRIARLPANE
uniref:Uncharacterized protein n=1 Tax=Oryza nivara TaxID=4536 RepID=A0A0E0HHM8_ORYNI